MIDFIRPQQVSNDLLAAQFHRVHRDLWSKVASSRVTSCLIARGERMNACESSQSQQMAADAAQWRELVALLNRKAYKTTITPEEIAAELPDLREIHRSLLADQPQAHPTRNGRLR
jgi:hypothetical protein